MDREAIRRHEAQFYSAYAEELREQFREGFLEELADLPQFVVWRSQIIDGKPKKPPYSPRFHKLADTTSAESWGTLDQALLALKTGLFNGIGFVFTKDDPYAGMDLDECVGNNRAVDKWAQDIIDALATHAHYSPRDGVHLIFSLDKPRFLGKNKKVGNFEYFDRDHYMTITPRLIPGAPQAIAKRDIEAAAVYFQHIPRELWPSIIENTRGSGMLLSQEYSAGQVVYSRENAQAALHQSEKPDEAIIQEALQQTRSNFSRYWSGNPDTWEGPTALKPSRSDAMQALLTILADKTGDNEEQVKRLYKQSGMYNPKRDDAYAGRDRNTGRRVTYLEMSTRNAIRWHQQQQRSRDRRRE